MTRFNSKLGRVAILGAMAMLLVTSATAIRSSDVSATITEPAQDSDVQTAMFGNSVDYIVELENTFANDTVVDLKLTFTDEDGNTYSKWYNDTTVEGNTVEDLAIEYAPDNYTPPEDSYASVTADVDATFTEELDTSDSATVSDSVDFNLKQNKTIGSLFTVFIVLGVIGFATKI